MSYVLWTTCGLMIIPLCFLIKAIASNIKGEDAVELYTMAFCIAAMISMFGFVLAGNLVVTDTRITIYKNSQFQYFKTDRETIFYIYLPDGYHKFSSDDILVYNHTKDYNLELTEYYNSYHKSVVPGVWEPILR